MSIASRHASRAAARCAAETAIATLGSPISTRPTRWWIATALKPCFAVSAPHRAAALDACREAIDTLKETIPLWKKEVYAGGEEWIGRGS